MQDDDGIQDILEDEGFRFKGYSWQPMFLSRNSSLQVITQRSYTLGCFVDETTDGTEPAFCSKVTFNYMDDKHRNIEERDVVNVLQIKIKIRLNS